MKIQKTFWALLLPLAIAFNASAALEEEGRMTEDNTFSGTLTSVNLENMEMVVNTRVPGILGEQTSDFPFKVDNDTEMTICVKTLANCHDLTGESAMGLLWSIQNTDISDYRTDVMVIRDPASERITHVRVRYSNQEEGKEQAG